MASPTFPKVARPVRIHPTLARWVKQQSRERTRAEGRTVSQVEVTLRLAVALTGFTLDTLPVALDRARPTDATVPR